MTSRCAWCGLDMGDAQGPPGVSHGICKCCEAIVCGQNALGLVIKLVLAASPRLKVNDVEVIALSKEDRNEITEAYALLNDERQRRAAAANECQIPAIDSAAKEDTK